MRKSAFLMTLLGVAALVGCDNPVEGCVGICVDAQVGDGGVPSGDAQVDAFMGDGGPPATCGDPGRTGGLCRTGALCQTGLTCVEELLIGGAALNVRNTFGIGQAAVDSANPELYNSVTTPVPADDIPITFATPSLCVDQCDTTAAADGCGACSKCSGQIGNDAIGIGAFVFIAEADREFDNDTGICRPHCSFEIDSNGGCPTGYTCDAFTNVCLEACRTTAGCNAGLVITEQLEYGTIVVPANGETCEPTTGRCEWTAPAVEPHVGDTCESQSQCAADIGICLRGGTCAETQCNNTAIATDTTMDGVCDGGNGICIGAGGNMGALCIDGCNTAMDCNPGNTCIPLTDASGAPVMIGTFSGYCLGICDTVFSGGDDETYSCRTGEQCDMPAATADDMDPDGTCSVTCDPAVATSCDTGEFCEAVAGTTYGFCRVTDSYCFDNTGCTNGQICNNAVGAPTFGRCVDPCTLDTECTAPQTCVLTAESATLAGLCSEPCVAATGTATCGAGRICSIPTGGTAGRCTEAPPAP